MTNETSQSPTPPASRPQPWWQDPIPFVGVTLVLSVLLLLAAAVTGLDRGRVVKNMADPLFARGLITYLFAVTTIGTAAVLSLAGLMGIEDSRFQHGKEILSLLLGVFGAIVGFYFGSGLQAAGASGHLHVTPPLLSEASIVGGARVQVTASVSNGKGPYSFILTTDEGSLEDDTPRPVRADGWIIEDIATPILGVRKVVTVTLRVTDAGGETVTTRSQLTVIPPGSGPGG